jgi:maltodextrin utilization protein YvdJ
MEENTNQPNADLELGTEVNTPMPDNKTEVNPDSSANEKLADFFMRALSDGQTEAVSDNTETNQSENAEEGEAAVTAREQKENASQHPETGTPTASTTPEIVVSTQEETASEVASAPAAIIEEVHSLEAESQKETFV